MTGDDFNNNAADDMSKLTVIAIIMKSVMIMMIMVIQTKARMVVILTKLTMDILMMNFNLMVKCMIFLDSNLSTSVAMMR